MIFYWILFLSSLAPIQGVTYMHAIEFIQGGVQRKKYESSDNFKLQIRYLSQKGTMVQA